LLPVPSEPAELGALPPIAAALPLAPPAIDELGGASEVAGLQATENTAAPMANAARAELRGAIGCTAFSTENKGRTRALLCGNVRARRARLPGLLR
jgi:hypothetical protein